MDIINLSNRIINGYKDYLKHSIYIKDHDFSAKFISKIEKSNWSKGPFLEVVPNFKKTISISEAVDKNLLNSKFKDIFDKNYQKGFDSKSFRLYEHQELAFEKIKRNRNIIITTGTSSGKTECYLFPIISYLLDEYSKTKQDVKGLRAILIFPMNALGNDQYERIQKIFKVLYHVLGNRMPFSFGKYTGETEKTLDKAKEKLRYLKNNQVVEGEKICRDQIRADPPNILITNYSMLEFLLLRPQDNNIFTREHAGNCKFIVLDEIHVYSGAKGVEIAYLLRRLIYKIKNFCNNLNINPNELYSNKPLEKIISPISTSQNDIIFIGTSATLASDTLNFRALSIFASQIFDAPVIYDNDKYASDIIQSTIIPGFLLDESQVIREYTIIDRNLKQEMIEIIDLIKNFDLMEEKELTGLIQKLENIVSKIPLECLVDLNNSHATNYKQYLDNLYEITKDDVEQRQLKNRIRALLFVILYYEKNIRQLFQALKSNVYNIEDLYKTFTLPGYEPDSLFYLNLIPCINIASISEIALFKIRYHLYFKSPAGIFAPLHGSSLISFDRITQDIDPYTGELHEFYETVFCRNCGQKYIKANFRLDETGERGSLSIFVSNNREQLNSLMVSEPKIKDSLELIEPDEEEKTMIESFMEENHIKDIIPLYYSVQRKTIFTKFDLISMNEEYLELKYFNFDPKENNMKKIKICLNCNYSGESIENKYRFVPEDPIHHLNLLLFKELNPSERKLLTFSDSRQKAAFYAVYMENKLEEMFFRNIFLKIAEYTPNNIIRMLNLVESYIQREYYHKIKPLRTDSSWLKSRIHRYLIWEFTNIKSRDNLEALALWKIGFNFPENWSISDKTKEILQTLNIPELNQLNEKDIMELIKSLLYISRDDFAFALENSISIKDLEKSFASQTDTFAFASSNIFGHLNQKFLVKNWSGSKTKRAKFMQKVFKSLGIKFADKKKQDEITVSILDCLFTELIELKSALFLKKETGLYKINLKSILVQKISNSDEIYQCNQCGKITTCNFNNICLDLECNGNLVKIIRKEANYNKFFEMYYLLKDFPFAIIEEHTSQLSNQKSREIQEQFKENEVNIISSSTTFEVGIDIGDLNFEILNNVPPNPSNYVQRVGRIGRGRNSTGSLVMVFCTVNSHDQFFFRDALKMIRGEINTIPLNIKNEYIARRHMNSEIISRFWLNNPSIRKISEIFNFDKDLNDSSASIAPKFQEFLELNNNQLIDHLNKIFPSEVMHAIGFPNENLKDLFFDEKKFKYFVLCFDTLMEDLESIKKAIEEMKAKESSADSKSKAKIWNNISILEKKMDNIRCKQIIVEFSRFTIIPKYGFPVDTVELFVRNDVLSSQIELQRDLSIAISEYAPGSDVIVNKMAIESYALMKPLQKEFEKYEYVYCPKCRYFKEKMEESIDESWIGKCYCGETILKPQKYIIPKYGFTTKKNYTPKKANLNKIDHVYLIQPFVITDRNVTQNLINSNNEFKNLTGDIIMRFFQPEKAKIVILCKGKNNMGYFICETCGYLEPRVLLLDDINTPEPSEAENQSIQKETSKKKTDLLFKKTKIKSHETWYLKHCTGLMKRIDLGHSFYTNTFKITLSYDLSVINSIYRITKIDEVIDANNIQERNRYDFLEQSFLYAFIYYISFFLQIPKNEISILFVSRKNEADLRDLEMVIYDSVPGGAGYVERISKLFAINNNQFSQESIKFFEDMKKFYEVCDCKIDTSCYRCIRTRENHEYHDYLRRDVLVKFIEHLLGLSKDI